MSMKHEIAAAAARMVVEEGLEYGPAKKRAARQLGLEGRRGTELPDNDQVEDEVFSYLDLFCADSHPAELAELRAVAATWMERLAEFRPHLTGAVWRGTATRRSAVHLQLFCDDSKAAEIALINHGITYELAQTSGPRGQPVALLRIHHRTAAVGGVVTVFLTILDHDDLRGALKPDARGRTPRGDLPALRRLITEGAA